MKISKLRILVSLSLLMAFATSLHAADPVWICSITQAVAVEEDGNVHPPKLEGKETPTFLHVDLEEMEVTILGPASRRGEKSEIKSVEKKSGNYLISGIEQERAWNMLISKDGYMSLSVVGDGAVWAVFGHALKE